jgi:valyl-tRNA synthetase
MLQDYYPNNVLETGYDIIFFWVAKMIIMWYEVMQDVPEWKPFEKVYLHWLVRDDKWKKMSKSKWNVIDPLDKIESHGSDVLRLSLVLWTTPGNDVNFSEEKLDYNKRFLNKLWNASRFVYKKAELDETETIDYNELFNLIKDNKSHLTSFDKRILSGLDELVWQVKDSIETFYFWEAFVNVQKFVWNKFCDWYIEISKYDDGPFTASVLIYSLWTIYKLLHPITPFITETLWHKIKFDWDLMVSNFSQQIWIEKDETIDSLVDIIIWLRTIRSINNVKPHLATDVYIENFENSKIKKYEDIIKRIVNINTFLENDKKNNIIVEVIWNIKIWVVIPEQELDYHEKVKELEKQLEAEQQFLQSIRKLLSSDWFRQKASEQIIKQKEDKKEEIEWKILKIKEEISKMKLKIK